MPRPFRLDYQGAWHHVMNRGAGHDAIFRDTLDRIIFLDLLQFAANRNLVRIHAYCLMGNHFHLLLENGGGSIAKTMQELTGRFTRRMNARNLSDGPIFRGRYRSVEVRRDRHLLLVSRYIHLNPVSAGLSVRPEDWRWSSAQAYVGRVAPPSWLVTNEILALFEEPEREAHAQFLAAGVDDLTAAFYSRERLGRTFKPGLGVRHLRAASA